jgi:hypothetical protein
MVPLLIPRRQWLLLCALIVMLLPAGAHPPVARAAPIAAPAAPAAPEKPAASKETEKKEDEKGKPEEKKPGEKSFDEVVKDAEKHEGLFTLYKVKKDLFAEIKPEQLDTQLLLQISRGSGVGERGIVFGNPVKDALVTLRKIEDQVQLIERNTLFRAPEGSALERSLRRSYSDSVLASFKVEATHKERQSILINLNGYFLTDVTNTAAALSGPGGGGPGGGYNFDQAKSYWSTLKAFPQNLELDAVGVYTSGRGGSLQNVPDARGFQVTTHFSLASLPPSDYRPRLFDPRVGYFVEAFRDYSDPERDTPFGRYILRWNLQKRDPEAVLSPPKKPIVFYLENNIPPEHRPAVRDGLLMWNRAFERIGIKDAIEVREQPDNADWDSNDFRYSTVRWVTSPDAGYAVAQFRNNPLTGEIVKANITIDGNWVRYAFFDYEDLANPITVVPAPEPGTYDPRAFCDRGQQAAAHLAFGATALDLMDVPDLPSEKEKLIYQSVREMSAHEMGHILGLRHNFHSSTLLAPGELHNTAITREKGVVSSVMDYCPVNLAPPGVPQGDYYSLVVGPYDIWAIEYGYTAIDARTPEEELAALKRIAGRAAQPELAYGTDEECDFGSEPRSVNPLITRFDLSRDPVGWAEGQIRLARHLLGKFEARVPREGKSYSEARRKFSRLMGHQLNMLAQVSKMVGGIYTSRSFRGDPGAGLPQRPVPAAEQRRALALIERHLFDTSDYQFSPSLLNRLARDVNWHWGINLGQMINSPTEYPLREQVLGAQRFVLARLLHPVLLSRLGNSEMRVASPADALTLPELLGRLTKSIWSEAFTDDVDAARLRATTAPGARGVTAPAKSVKKITAMRRSLQREHLGMMIGMMLQPAPGTPEDARTLAWSELTVLQARLIAAQKAPAADAYTRAHLAESAARIARALDARIAVTAR